MTELSRKTGDTEPLLFDSDMVEACEKLAVLIPGALARVDMFAPTQAWTTQGYALAHYRFPGLDGRPITPKLHIEKAAAHIANFCAQYPGKAVRLLGYSTGGPIAISAAERLTGDVRVAAMSSAVPHAGGFTSLQRITRDVLGSARRARSLSRRVVWREYFKLLLFGNAVLSDPERAKEAEALLEAHLPRMVYPDRELLAAHSDNLRLWSLPGRRRLLASQLAFFVGAADPVFSAAQTARFAQNFGDPPITSYPGHGHLLFMTLTPAFDDILAFFEA